MTRFKETELGRLPTEWEVAKVSDIFEVITGTTPSTKIPEYWKNATINWFTPADMTDITGQVYLTESSRKITRKGVDDTTLTILPVGSLIISTRAPVGYVGVLTREAAFNQGCKGLIPKRGKKISPEFYYYYFSKIQKKLQNMSSGSTFMELGKDAFERCQIVYLNYAEQQRIASILSTVDDAIEKAGNIIEKTGRLKRGMMNKLLTRGIGHKEFNETELGMVPKGWEVAKIGEFSLVETGSTPLTSNKNYWNGNIPWMSSGEIHQGFIKKVGKYITKLGMENSNTTLLPKKTIVMAMNGQGKTRGTVGILELETTCNQSIAGIILKKQDVDPYYLYYNLQSRYLELRNLSGAGRSGLNLGLIGNVKVPIPPILEQQKIAIILSSFDEKLEFESKRKEKLERVKKALMNDLLTGKKRAI